MEPYDYKITIADPFGSAIEGYKSGIASQDAAKLREQQLQANSLVLQQTQRQDESRAALSLLKNPTFNDYQTHLIKYPNDLNLYKGIMDIVGGGKKDALLNLGMQIKTSLSGGNLNVANKIVNDAITAYTNSGDNQTAQLLQTLGATISSNPTAARDAVSMMLVANGGADVETAFMNSQLHPSKLAQEQAVATKAANEADASKYLVPTAQSNFEIKRAEAANTPAALALKNKAEQANIASVNSQIVARQNDAAMKQQELAQKAYELPESARKIVNDSAAAALGLNQEANNLISLASNFRKSGAVAGKPATIADWLKAQVGNQNEIDKLRQEYVRIRNDLISKQFQGQGSISNEERASFLKGFPSENSDINFLASTLETMAKVKQVRADIESKKQKWVEQNKWLGASKKPTVIDGIEITAGTSFSDFIKSGTQSNQQQSQAQSQSIQYSSEVAGRSYLKKYGAGAK